MSISGMRQRGRLVEQAVQQRGVNLRLKHRLSRLVGRSSVLALDVVGCSIDVVGLLR